MNARAPIRPTFRATALAMALAISPWLTARPASALPLVEARIAPTAATVGDRIEVVLTLSRTGALPSEPRFPAWTKRWGQADVLEVGKVEKSSGPDGPVYRQRLVLSSFQTGRIELPPVGIGVPAGAAAGGEVPVFTPSSLALDIRSVLPSEAKEKNPKPKPESPPRALPIGRAVWWTLGALALACAAVLWADRVRRRRRAEAGAGETRPLLSPFDELLQTLAGGDASAPVEAHTRLSLALRRYLGRRLPFPAIESTTTEIQRQLASRRLPPAAVAPTIDLLRACDWVKFARRPVEGEETLRRFERARNLAQELEGHFAPPAPAPVPEPARRPLGRGVAR